MTAKQLRSFGEIWLPLLVLGSLWVISLPAASAEDTPSQVTAESIQVAMLAKTTVFMQHQPIVIHYDVFNPSTEAITIASISPDIDGFIGGPAWAQVALVDVHGKFLLQQEDVHGISTSGFGATYMQRVDPNEHVSGEIVTNRWFKTPSPGKYTLVVVADQHVFRFPITVIADDHDKLKATAKEFGDEAIDTTDFNRRRFLTQAVCVFPEEDALAVWQQLSDKLEYRGLIARELARNPSDTAADFLAKSVWSSNVEEKFRNGRLLDTMYNEGTPELRAHIRAIFAQHGVAQLPQKLVLTEDGG